MQQAQLLELIRGQIIFKYEEVAGKACFLEFLMRYLVDQCIKKTGKKIEVIVKENNLEKSYSIKDAWGKGCKLNQIEKAICDIFQLSIENKNKLEKSRKLRDKLLHFDFIELALLLDRKLQSREITLPNIKQKILSKEDDRIEQLIVLDHSSNNDILPKCKSIFEDSINIIQNLFSKP